MGFRLIGLMKISSGVLMIAAGFGIFRMMHRDIGGSLEREIVRLHLDPDNRLIHAVISRVSGIDHHQLKLLGVGTFFYALLHLVEGTGLVLLKHWAEYLTVIATASLLPLEFYEISQRRTAVRVGVLAINLAIFLYLIFKIRQQRAQRLAQKN